MNKYKLIITVFQLLFVLLATSLKASETIAEFHLDFRERVEPPQALLPYQKLERPTIGLALSGGGLRGVAQIGVLKVLEENNIPIDYIVGTSIGAIIGGLYASGYSPDEIWNITKSFDWEQVLNDAPERSSLLMGEKQKRARALLQIRLDGLKPVIPEALSPGQNLGDFLTELVLDAPFHSYYFDQLRVPFRVISTDILSGEKVVIDRGDLAEMIRASISIPLLFNPVEAGNRLLVDGGVLDNIPVDETRKLGADLVVAVNTTSPLRTRKDLQAPWEIADQVTTIMQIPHNQVQLDHADFVVSIADIQSTSSNQDNVDSLYQESIRRTEQQLAAIKAKLAGQSEKRTNDQLYYVDEIVLPRDMFTAAPVILANRHISRDEIMQVLRDKYSTGWYQSVSAEIVNENDKNILKYNLVLNPVLDQVHFLGNTIYPDSVLIKPFLPLLHKPVNHEQSVQALHTVIETYRKGNYSLAEISNVSYSPGNKRAIVTLSEGKIAHISYTGNVKTRQIMLENEFTLHKGDIFRSNIAFNGINNIYSTGLFRSVSLKIEPESPDFHIQIQLQEKETNVIRYGFRYDDERWGRSFLEFAEENMLGMGHDLTLHMLYGERDRELFADYRIDRIFDTYLTAQANLFNSRKKFFTYNDGDSDGEYWRHATGITFKVGQHMERFGLLSGFMRLEEIDIDAVSGNQHTLDTGILTVNTIGVTSVVDSRDRVPFPRSGNLHEFIYQVSTGQFKGDNISYYKVYNRLENYFTFGKRHTFRPVLLWATCDVLTPYSEQFQLGGLDSFYGLRENSLHGKHEILVSLEYRLALNKLWLMDVYLSARVDYGAVWQESLDINFDHFVNGRGLALSFQTPIGPLSIAYGQANTRDERVYLSAGYEF